MEGSPRKRFKIVNPRPNALRAHRDFSQHVAIDDRAAVERQAHVEEIKKPKDEDELPSVKASFWSHIELIAHSDAMPLPSFSFLLAVKSLID
jgi:hypothetical protein